MTRGTVLILTLWLSLLGVRSACAGGLLDHCAQGHHEHPAAGDTDDCANDPCAQGYDAPVKTTRVPTPVVNACSLAAPTAPAAFAAAAPTVRPPWAMTGEPPRPAGGFPLLI